MHFVVDLFYTFWWWFTDWIWLDTFLYCSELRWQVLIDKDGRFKQHARIVIVHLVSYSPFDECVKMRDCLHTVQEFWWFLAATVHDYVTFCHMRCFNPRQACAISLLYLAISPRNIGWPGSNRVADVRSNAGDSAKDEGNVELCMCSSEVLWFPAKIQPSLTEASLRMAC